MEPAVLTMQKEAEQLQEPEPGIYTTAHEQLAKQRIFRRAEEANPLAVGRWVYLRDLRAEHLNGRSGLIIVAANAEGRLGVRVAGFGDKLVRLENLEAFRDEEEDRRAKQLGGLLYTCEETVKVARLFARGERGSGVTTWRWPHMALHDKPFEMSPVSERIGLPLYLTRVEPDRPLPAQDDRENSWATRLMADPETGQVPLAWQSLVGPVVVWREDGQDFSADDLCLVASFAAALEHGGPRRPGCTPQADPWLPDNGGPLAFERFRRQELAVDPLDPDREQWWEDVNI